MPNDQEQPNSSFQDKSVCIGIPCGELVQADMMMCLLQTVRSLQIPNMVVTSKSCYVARNRNEIVAQAKSFGVTHLMFIDSDMAFENAGIEKLMAHDKDIVGAMYNKRRLPLENIVYEYTDQTELFELKEGFLPTGFMLIKMSVFEKLPEPWFESISTRGWAEDRYFCEEARKAGFKIYCDPTIKLKHIGNYPY